MSDLLQDIETYLISKSLITSANRDTINDSPDSVVALYEYTGKSPAPQIAGALRNVQVVVRDKSATAAKNRIREIYNAFETEDGIIYFTEDRWCTIQLNQPPFKMKVDNKERVLYCFNISLVTYLD